MFVGTSVAVEDAATQNGVPYVRVRFQIDEAIQNIDRKTADVLTASDTAACGVPFEKGRKYLVYASGNGGVYSVSFCSRTGLLDARRDDLELLREAAAGSVRPRLFGTIYRLQLLLDGFYMHYGTLGGVADVPVRVVNGDRVRETRTDAKGNFSIRDVSPGRHAVQPQLSGQYAPLFDREDAVRVDTCSGETGIGVATIPLRGTVRAADGEALVPSVKLRVAQLDSSGRVTFERSTLAFAEADGSWKVPGLPSGRYVLGVSAFNPTVAAHPVSDNLVSRRSSSRRGTCLRCDRRGNDRCRLPPARTDTRNEVPWKDRDTRRRPCRERHALAL